MKVKKKKRKIYNADFATLKPYQIFDDSEGRYIHYGSKLRKKHPDRFSLKWENVNCPHCLAHHKQQEQAAKKLRLLAKKSKKGKHV